MNINTQMEKVNIQENNNVEEGENVEENDVDILEGSFPSLTKKPEEPEVTKAMVKSEKELRNIKYKTQITTSSVSTNNLNELATYLESEKQNNITESWNKLNKTTKFKKIEEFVATYSEQNKFTDVERTNLKSFLKDSIERNRLQKVKEVIYDKNTGLIKNIPGLLYNKSSNHFTLKNVDNRHVSTAKSLMPKKNATVKNV